LKDRVIAGKVANAVVFELRRKGLDAFQKNTKDDISPEVHTEIYRAVCDEISRYRDELLTKLI